MVSIKAIFPQKCIGCELCVMEVQRQLGRVGLDGSLIRVLKHLNEETNSIEYAINIDPQVNNLDINKIRDICPTGVFVVEESTNESFS
jgi:NAD-dependent dihydropyrimidine dehydrogenase PreA subunit